MKALIVDDQHEVRRMIKAAFEAQFPQAVLQDVPSAEEALILLAQEDFDLMVVDVRLAGMSGLEMIEKARRRQPKLNIVVITGLNDRAIHQQLEQAPIQAWFRKPLPMDDFLACVTNLVGEPASTSPSPQPTASPAESIQPPEASANPLDTLCEQLGLSGLGVADSRGVLLAVSTAFPNSLRFSDLSEYFLRVETEVTRIQSRCGAEEFPLPPIYLSKESVVAQIHLDDFRILYCVERRTLPQQNTRLAIAILQKGQLLLETLKAEPSIFAQLSASSLPQSAAEPLDNVPPDSALEALFQNPSPPIIQTKQADEFWEQVLESSSSNNAPSDSQTLYFDQARELGILPSEDDEGKI